MIRGKYKDGMIISKNLYTSDVNSGRDDNVLVIGGSGAEKEYSYTGPNILQADSSYVIVDIAGGLYEHYAPFLEYKGYDVKRLNLIDPEKGDKYNPFEYIRSDRDIEDLVSVMIASGSPGLGKNPFWEKAEHALLTALIAYLYHYGNRNSRNISSVIKMMKSGFVRKRSINAPSENLIVKTIIEQLGGEDIAYADSPFLAELIAYIRCILKDKTEQTLSSALDTIRKLDIEQGGYSSKTPLDYLFDDIEKEDPDSFAVRKYKTFRISAGKTHDNIILSCLVRLQVFDDAKIAAMMDCDSMNLDLISNKKTAAFITISSGEKSKNIIAAMMYSQIIERLCKYSEETAEFSQLVVDGDGQIIKTYRASSLEESDEKAAEADLFLNRAKEGAISYNERPYGENAGQYLIIARNGEVVAHRGSLEEAEYALEKIREGRVVRHKKHSLPVQTKIIFDQFCNIGMFPKISEWFARSGGRRMSYSVIIHSFSQVQKMYGNEWDVAVSAFGTVLYLGGGCDSAAAEWFTRIIRERPIVSPNKQHTKTRHPFSYGKPEPQSHSSNELIKTLRTLEKDMCIVIPKDGDVYKDRTYSAAMHPNWETAKEQCRKKKEDRPE